MSHIASCAQVIKLSLDGKNQEVVLLEFGIRVHRELYEHILSFTINSIGNEEIGQEKGREGLSEMWTACKH